MDYEKFFHRDPISDRGISVVMPVLNDAATLEADIAGVTATLDRLVRGHEIIVADDGSTDATAEIVARLAAANRRIQFMRRDASRGHGAALRSGFAAAKYPLVWQFDGGNQFDAADFLKLLSSIDHWDVVCAYRENAAATRGGFGQWLYRWWLSGVFAVRVRDVDCGFKLFRRAALRRIPIQSDGRFASAEILAKATFMNMLITEVAVAGRPRADAATSRPEPFGRTLREAGRVFRRPHFTSGETDDKPSPNASHAA